MTPARLALVAAEARLVARLQQLDAKLAAGDESAWSDYCQTAAALATVAPQTVPGADGAMLTTAEMAERLGITPKTLLRRAKRGAATPVRLGQRGRAAVRWPA